MADPHPNGADWEAIDASLRSDLEWSWARKASIDARSASLVALNVGVVTVFLTLRLQLEIGDALSEPRPAWWVVTGLIAAGASLVLCVLVLVPLFYPGNKAKVYTQYIDEYKKKAGYDHREELLLARIGVLKRLDLMNAVRGWLLFSAFVGAAFATFALGYAVLQVAVPWP